MKLPCIRFSPNAIVEGSTDGDAYIDGGSDDEQPRTQVSDNDTTPDRGGRYQDNTLTVGFVGHPNVGKSSFLNAVCG